MKKILITGGAGNVGGSLGRRLVEDQENFVVVVDNLLTGDVLKLPQQKGNWKFIKCDVNVYDDISAVMLAYSFDYVFHYAAVVGVQRTLANPILVLKDVDGIRNVLNLSKNTGVKRVFYSSSSEVYGEPVESPQNERTTPLNSRLPYAIVKNLGEAYLRSYYQEYGLEYTIFRFFNTYGPMQSNDFVISKFISAALADMPITIYGDGSQSRTFCYITDNLDMTVKTWKENHFVNDVVNVGSDVEQSIVNLAQLVIRVLNSKSQIVHLPPLKEGDMARRRPDVSKMRSVLGRDLLSLESGILSVAAHLKGQKPGA
jgi:nucleoside-diphosphate-sugar epimerase